MKSQKGNVLFIILIAVALFGALSYGISQSGRGNLGIKNETMLIATGRIDSYMAAMQSTVDRIKMSNNIRSYDIYFNNDIYKKVDNTLVFSAMGSPTDPSAYLFHPQGGKLTPLTFENISGSCGTCTGATKPGHLLLRWANIPGIGSSTPDLIAGIAYVTPEFCQHVNSKTGISTTPVISYTTYIGSVTRGTPPTAFPALPSSLTGKKNFCIGNTTTPPSYHYYALIDAL